MSLSLVRDSVLDGLQHGLDTSDLSLVGFNGPFVSVDESQIVFGTFLGSHHTGLKVCELLLKQVHFLLESLDALSVGIDLLILDEFKVLAFLYFNTF